MKQAFLLVLIFITHSYVLAQKTDTCHYELNGVILDEDTKDPLPYVQVNIKGTQQVTITDVKGQFHFTGLCNEKNVLIISCSGYCDTTCEQHHEHGKSPHIYLKQKVNSLSAVTVSVAKPKEAGTTSISQQSINKETLDDKPTQTLAGAISEIDGVTFTSTGTNVQLPVIHGLYGNRVLILNNGLKHGFQNWGSDHAPEIDISSANNITVVKGAAGVRFGPEALGGAIIVEADPLHLNEDMRVDIGTGYQTNGRGYNVKTGFGKGMKKWSYYVGAGYTKIGDRHTPDYSMTNSGKQEISANAGIRYHLEKWDFRMYYSYVSQDLALLRSSIAESGNLLIRAIDSEQPLFIRPFSYDINEPNQLTQHHLGKAEINWWYSKDSKITLRIGQQFNKRSEYDVRRNAYLPIIDLNLATTDVQLEWKHPDWKKLDGLVGLQLFSQNNDNNPGTGTTPFIPNYNSIRYSGFVIETLKKTKSTYELGIRFDYINNNVRGRETSQAIFRDNYHFSNLTSSLGYLLRLSDNSTFRTNLGAAWRTPNMAELYSFGQHGFKTSFGLLRYSSDENGALVTSRVTLMNQSAVKPEKGLKWVNELESQQGKNNLAVTAYTHYIQHFIFNRPVAVIGTIRGPMPVFIYDQVDALFMGVDFTWRRELSDKLSGTYGISYLWSHDIEKNEALINQPPIRTHLKLAREVHGLGIFKSSKFTISPSYTFKQFQAPRTIRPEQLIDGSVQITTESEIFDFKNAPNGYFLLDVSWSFKWKGIRCGVSIQNSLNTRYRDYLNEMRYFSNEVGRNFQFTINYTIKP
ncbi:MAG: TonB-dependent receptor [Bacteroidetes bacterium]|nr:TonB-dependent receptor [Bacteroidota bacterium]